MLRICHACDMFVNKYFLLLVSVSILMAAPSESASGKCRTTMMKGKNNGAETKQTQFLTVCNLPMIKSTVPLKNNYQPQPMLLQLVKPLLPDIERFINKYRNKLNKETKLHRNRWRPPFWPPGWPGVFPLKRKPIKPKPKPTKPSKWEGNVDVDVDVNVEYPPDKDYGYY